MKITNVSKRFLADKKASILPTFAIMILPLMVTMGAAVDYTIAAKNRSKLVNVADAAILAAAIKAKEVSDPGNDKNIKKVETILKEEIDAFMKANTLDGGNSDFKDYDIKFNPKTLGVELKIAYSFDTSFMSLVGVDEIAGQVETAVFLPQDERTPLSMMLVLDKSGSMNSSGVWNWNGYRWVYTPGEHRMTSLKNAVSNMLQDFEKEDPEHKYVRTGAVAYSSSVYYRQARLNWGSAHTNNFTQGLYPGGGTDSSGAMDRAYRYLKGNKEENQHKKKNKGNAKKYIVFMTDGSNNYSSADTRTLNTCRKAKKKDIIIYTVAFQAPERGQNLLKACASSSSHYFNATNSEQLSAAFKHIGQESLKLLAIAK